jgi:hypothetical protein
VYFITFYSPVISADQPAFPSTGQAFGPVDAKYAGRHCIYLARFFSDKERKDTQD